MSTVLRCNIVRACDCQLRSIENHFLLLYCGVSVGPNIPSLWSIVFLWHLKSSSVPQKERRLTLQPKEAPLEGLSFRSRRNINFDSRGRGRLVRPRKMNIQHPCCHVTLCPFGRRPGPQLQLAKGCVHQEDDDIHPHDRAKLETRSQSESCMDCPRFDLHKLHYTACQRCQLANMANVLVSQATVNFILGLCHDKCKFAKWNSSRHVSKKFRIVAFDGAASDFPIQFR
jgi:hypothetical protein